MPSPPEASYAIEPLDTSRHDRATFSCGIPELDVFLKTRARRDMESGASATHVACVDRRILGFVTACNTLVNRTRGYPEQWVLLSRMAVATEAQGGGVGHALTTFVCRFALEASVVVGTRGVIVDAKPSALTFYRRLGFSPYDSLPTATGTSRLMLLNEAMRDVVLGPTTR